MRIQTLLEVIYKKSPETRDFVKYSRIKKPVFHGTASNFDVFDIDRSDLGPHFGSLKQAHKALDRHYSDVGGPNIRPVYLKLENPLRLKDEGSFHADAIIDQLLKKKLIDKKLFSDIKQGGWHQRKHYNGIIRQILFRAGYDGIVYKNKHEGDGDSYIVFSHEQIKPLFS